MKYTFDKFQVELVAKPNPSFRKNTKLSFPFQPKYDTRKRNIKTAQLTQRQNPQFDSVSRKNTIDNQIKFGQQSGTNIARSQSLKSDMKDQYKNWLNYSNVSVSLKQKQYKIFQQKCIDLLSKKKFHAKSQSQKRSQVATSMNKRTIQGSNSQHQTIDHKQNTVQQMMNNIIQKFKNDERQRKYIHQQIKKNRKNQQKPEQQPFFTISNDFVQEKHKSMRYGQQTPISSQIIKSTQLRRSYQGQNRIRKHLKFEQEDIQFNESSQPKCFDKSWKQIPDVTGIRVNKKVNNQGYPKFNPLTCTSLALSSPSRQLKRNLLAFEHIKLSPYSKQARSQLSTYPKRKKIHLNKPSAVKKFMKFTKNSSDEQYNKKIKAYLDFLFKINFSNNIYVSLQLASLQDTINLGYQKYKVYVGPGNNSLLIKSLLKRRQWIQIIDNINEQGIQFYWTQNKINQIHYKQQNSNNYKRLNTSQQRLNQRKKSSIKIINDNKQLNSKLLTTAKCEEVENYIFSDGYQVPFQKDYQVNIVTNHIPQNCVIGSKKNLFKSLFSYYTNVVNKDPFTVIPKTYHIKSPQDPQFKRFVKQNNSSPNKLWIVKPGQNTNRGNGIKLRPFNKIQSLIKEKIKHPNGHLMTYIVQSYINRPFLYNGRKFDIRHYMLITSVNGILKAYWYRDGYIRTSSQFYDLQDTDNQFIHLTNDAIQQKSQSYGAYQDANKLSYTQFQRYLDYSFPGRGYNFENITKQMKSIILDVIKSSYLNLDKQRKRDNFQLFGFDFMIDNNFKPYLIQINFNPCLVVNCNILNRIIPPLIQNTLRIGLDPLLTPKNHLPVNKRNNLSQNYLKNLRYQLIFDQASLQSDIYNKPELQDSDDQQQQYCDNGKQLPQNVTF